MGAGNLRENSAEGRVPMFRTTPPARLRALLEQVSPIGYGDFKDNNIFETLTFTFQLHSKQQNNFVFHS